jgi:LAO/AO transport system kinase
VTVTRFEVAHALNDAESNLADARRRTRERLAAILRDGACTNVHTIGITGPPGVGKSSLAAALVHAFRAKGKTVAVLAIDPSSVRSGGALLGDRVRMALDPEDQGVFVRSMATAGELGGIARSVPVAALLLAASFDVVFVETVGIGQSETDVRHVVDTLLFVLQPGSGDAVQFLKAGIMEVPDVFAVNKCDQATADATLASLRVSIASLRGVGILSREPAVVSTSATSGQGVSELASALEAHRADLLASGLLASRRHEGAVTWLLAAFARRYGEVGIERKRGTDNVRKEIRARLDAGQDPLSVLDAMTP